jgi:hypothetical protein
MREIMHPRLGEPLPDAAPELDPVDEELEEGVGAGEGEDGEDNGVRGGVATVRLEGDALRARLHKGQFAFGGKGVRRPAPPPVLVRPRSHGDIAAIHTSTALECPGSEETRLVCQLLPRSSEPGGRQASELVHLEMARRVETESVQCPCWTRR